MSSSILCDEERKLAWKNKLKFGANERFRVRQMAPPKKNIVKTEEEDSRRELDGPSSTAMSNQKHESPRKTGRGRGGQSRYSRRPTTPKSEVVTRGQNSMSNDKNEISVTPSSGGRRQSLNKTISPMKVVSPTKNNSPKKRGRSNSPTKIVASKRGRIASPTKTTPSSTSKTGSRFSRSPIKSITPKTNQSPIKKTTPKNIRSPSNTVSSHSIVKKIVKKATASVAKKNPGNKPPIVDEVPPVGDVPKRKPGRPPGAPNKTKLVGAKQIVRKYGGRREVTPVAMSDESIKTPGRKISKDEEGPSHMKTRLIARNTEKEEAANMCILCRSMDGPLFQCAECNVNYHLRKCMRYSDEVASFIESGKRNRWLCARCVSCHICNEFICDPSNVECCVCALSFHGKCADKGGKIREDDRYYCTECSNHTVIDEMDVVKEIDTREKMNNTWKRGRKSKVLELKKEQFIDESNHLITKRDLLFNGLVEINKRQQGMMSPPHSPHSFDPSSPQISPVKTDKIALQTDINLFEAAKAALAEEKRKKSRHLVFDDPSSSPTKWIYIGSRKDKMKSLYQSPYHQSIIDAPNVYICPYCLRPNTDADTFRIHQNECAWACPPGNEIYRDNHQKISFFEVDGEFEPNYCRRVCLLGKLFIGSKTLVDEVDTFLFYILLEHTSDGLEFVGYFSKEKNPSKNNNLSCLLTLPNAMKKGYGRLLIDLSYELSRIERKVGSPEHPLSDLGLFAYRGYWRSAIICYLRSLRGSSSISLKQISLSTRITQQDVINQLLRDHLLLQKNGQLLINIEQRALCMPLSLIRRKTIDHSKLKWLPSTDDYLNLDEDKVNYYI